ncbi:hypothetical protein AB7254_21605 [Providencia rettgeri]
MSKINTLKVTNIRQTKGLDEINVSHIRPRVQTFERHLEDVKITLFGPRIDGGYILRIEGKPSGQSLNIKGHVELNIKSGALHRVLSEQKLYDDIAAMKLAQFVGYIGENHARKAAEAGELLRLGYIKNRGKTAKPFLSTFQGDKRIVPDSVFSLQNTQGHGIDLICRVEPYPPKPKWITIETKTVMKENFGQYATPKGGNVSDYQKNPITNLMTHLDYSRNSNGTKINSAYKLTKEESKMSREIYKDILKDRSLVSGYKLTIGIDTSFEVSKNSKYSKLFIFEELK